MHGLVKTSVRLPQMIGTCKNLKNEEILLDFSISCLRDSNSFTCLFHMFISHEHKKLSKKCFIKSSNLLSIYM